MTTSVEDRGSWGDDIRAIEHSKKNLSWELNEPSTQVKRINLRERRNQERELDPILMKYRNTEKEEAYMSKRTAFIENTLARSSTSRSKFNIINHQGPPKEKTYEPPQKSADSLHLISNLLHKDHVTAPVLYDQNYYVQRFVPKTNSNSKSVARRRDFSIISNKYYENHESKLQSEFEKLQEDVTKKYWETHGYNPVVGQFYSDADEERYTAQLKEVESRQGSSQACRIPPSVFYSEGKSYNIVNHTVMDEERLATSLTATTRTLNRVRKVQEKAKAVRDASVAERERQEQQRMQRVRFHRWQEGIDRGYDLMTNNSFDVTNPATVRKMFPLPKRPCTVYDKLATPTSFVARAERMEGAAAASETTGSGSMWKDLSGSTTGLPGSNSQQNSGRLISTANNAVRSGGGSCANSARPQHQQHLESGRSERHSNTAGSARSNHGGGGGGVTMTATTSKTLSVPRLEMNRVEPPTPVGYVDDNATGPPGVPIPIVRTGGLSGMRT